MWPQDSVKPSVWQELCSCCRNHLFFLKSSPIPQSILSLSSSHCHPLPSSLWELRVQEATETLVIRLKLCRVDLTYILHTVFTYIMHSRAEGFCWKAPLLHIICIFYSILFFGLWGQTCLGCLCTSTKKQNNAVCGWVLLPQAIALILRICPCCWA